ncbi:MAG: CBS domain-containing protein [bacterium]
MQVKEIMSTKVITVKHSHTLKQLLETFASFHLFPLVAVTNEDGRLTGVVSFRNLLNAFHPRQSELLKGVPFLDEQEEDIFQEDFTKDIGTLVIVEDIMESNFISIKEDAPLQEAYNLMKFHLKEEIPVINSDSKLVGIIGIFDIVRQIFYEKGVI